MKGIVFDLGWTLCCPPTGHWMLPVKFFDLVSRETWENIPQQRIDSVLVPAMERLHSDHLFFDEGEEFVRFLRFYTEIAEGLPELGLHAADVEELAYDKVYNDANMAYADNVKDVVLRLKERYKVGVLSDTWPSTERILRALGLWDLFDGIVFSCYEGVLKPDEKMYRAVTQKLDLPPQELLFIDDLQKNLDGAKRFGMQVAQPLIYPSVEPLEGYDKVKRLEDLIIL